MNWPYLVIASATLYFGLLAWHSFRSPVPLWVRGFANAAFWVSLVLLGVFELHS